MHHLLVREDRHISTVPSRVHGVNAHHGLVMAQADVETDCGAEIAQTLACAVRPIILRGDGPHDDGQRSGAPNHPLRGRASSANTNNGVTRRARRITVTPATRRDRELFACGSRRQKPLD